MYIDELLTRLKLSGFGCHIGHHFTGALAYADDVVLVAPTIVSMSKLLDTCSTFSKEYHVKFNPDKSKHMTCGRNENYSNLFMDNLTIPKVDAFEHLGHMVGLNSL